MRRVTRAPAILFGTWAMTVAVSVPLTLAMRGMIAQHLGSSLAADTVASGVNYEWMQEFSDQATGLGATLTPTVIGAGAVLDNLSSFIDDGHRPVVIVGAAAAYLVLWLFVAGGIIDRYARERPTRAHGFFAASGVFFFRFLRLGVVMWIVYGLLFRYLHRWLFNDLYPRMTVEVTVERTAFFIRVALYALFGAVLAVCNLIFDYAKVRAVVEDRRSMLGSIAAAVRFAGAHYPAVVSLYAVDFALFLVVVALYAAVAPGAAGAGVWMWLAFAVGQLYVLARLWVKLVFWASETALFQSRLAHARYVVRPAAVWPESPVAEAISN
jgi:hypothetical protein